MTHDHHTHDHTAVSFEEALALLRYMADHNAHHAAELQQTAAALPAEAAKLIADAVKTLEQSTEQIRKAIAKAEE